MVLLRGRPVIPIPVHPERVVSRAIKAGLSATIVLQRDISNRGTKKYYDRSHERWRIRQSVYQITKDRGKPDFSHISKAEASIRDDTRQMFYENAAKYGFTEVIRQKNVDDTVDPLNQRINACGRVVREISEIMFPLPDPMDFGTYTRRDGKGRKKYRRAGYEGSSFGPKVILAHPDLPSLDFGDAVRSHNEYLATFCAIHDVSVRETARYSHLFFLLVRPYLEYLYSEFKFGKANFQKGVNWALRQVKELIIDAGFQPTMYEKRTVTKKIEARPGVMDEEKRKFFKRAEEEARETYGNHPAVAELSNLRGTLGDDEKSESREKDDDDSILTVKDVDHIRNEAARRARIKGSIMHRRIADLFPSPWHMNDVILSGDRYARTSDYIIITEVPLQTKRGLGKVDLILCERTISDDGKQVYWKPVFVLEIKTRLGQSWYLDANYKESEVRPDNSPLQRVVPDFPLSDHSMSDKLWNTIVKSTPTPSARNQLKTYCQALTELYQNTTKQEPGQILRGVIVIDAASDITEVRKIVEQLIIYTYDSVKNRVRSLKRTIFTPPESDTRRVVLVLDEQPAPGRKREGVAQAPWGPRYTPFKSQKETKRRFILHLAGHSPTSAGQSAAWNARYYLGLQMLHEMKETQKDTEFFWVDLADQFNHPQLAEARLRLRPRGYSEEEVAMVQPDHIREFFESIEVNGHLDGILDFLYKDGELPSFRLKMRKNKRKVVIVSGADTLRESTPTSHRERLTVLIDHLLSSLPDNERTTVVWFDSPTPSVEKSVPYSCRALLPFYETSTLGEVVTEIVWNLPVAPRGVLQPEKWGLPVIGSSPMHDDIRVIVRHSPKEFQIELTHVPVLRGWSKRFINKGTGLVTQTRAIDDLVPDKTVRDRMKFLSLTMIPWLVKLWPQETLTEDSAETLEQQLTLLVQEYRGVTKPLILAKMIPTEPPCKAPSILALMRFRLPQTMDAKSFQEMTAGKINSQRLYRSKRKLNTRPLQQIPTPQSEELARDIEEELEQDWLFGVKFVSDDSDPQPWWLVVQDPDHPSRILVGCFADRPLDKDGFLWAESRQETMTRSSLEDILSFNQTIIIGQKTETGMEVWSSTDGGNDDALHEGILELKGQGRSSVGHLRAFRQTIITESKDVPSFSVRPSEVFYSKIVDSLRRHLKTVTTPTPVTLQLGMEDDACEVRLVDDEGEVIQVITIQYNTYLISFLRRPMTGEGPLFTDSGEFVKWSVFDSIDYGDLDFIRPYVTYTAARKTPKELPERVSQFFDKAKTLSVSFVHDRSVCPMVTEGAVGHGECWRIPLPSDCPEEVRKQLGKPMTGEEVNGILSPGRFFTSGRLYHFKITRPTVSAMDESIVYHEDKYIRILLRGLGLSLKQLPAGTFLEVSDQKWQVSISWEDTHILSWRARSMLSGLSLDGSGRAIKLQHGHDIEKECKRIIDSVASLISPTQISNYDNLVEDLRSTLRERGYGETSPECEFRVTERSESVFRSGVFLIGEAQKALVSFNFEVEEITSPLSELQGLEMSLADGDLSVYNIINTEDYMEELSQWMSENVSDVEEGGEPEVWTVYLSTDRRQGAIVWEAEVDETDKTMTGVLYDDPKELIQGDAEEAVGKVQDAFEGDVVAELKNVSNFEEVLKSEIPKMVKELREHFKISDS